MNRVERRKRQAAAKGCHAFRRGSWPIYENNLDRWDVYVEAEGPLGPRDLSMSKREAIALAYAISKSARPELVVARC